MVHKGAVLQPEALRVLPLIAVGRRNRGPAGCNTEGTPCKPK